MKTAFTILSLVFFISASGQMLFDSVKTERLLTALPTSRNQMKADENIIKAIEAVDRKYIQIVDTLYGYTSLKHTILQTIIIETNDSLAINPLAFGTRIQTRNIIFNNSELNRKVDSIARSLKRLERSKLFNYLSENFDYFSRKEKKLKPKPVRIKYVKFPDANLVHVGIDIYGRHFLWTIDKAKDWDVVKVESLWVY